MATCIIIVMCGFEISDEDLYKNAAKWCKFLAVDSPSFVIQCSMFLMEIVLIIIMAYSLNKRRKYIDEIPMSKIEMNINLFIRIWGGVSISRSIIGVYVYLFGKDNFSSVNYFLYMSSLFNLLIAFAAFFLHSLLIKIPCIWLSNILNSIDNKHISSKFSKKLNNTYHTIKKIEMFYKIRYTLLLVYLCCELTMVYCPEWGAVTDFIEALLISVEACIIFAIYTYAFLMLKRFWILINIPQQMTRQLLKEYLMLVFCCISRILFNALFFALIIFPTQNDENKYDEHCLRNFSEQRLKYLWYMYSFPGYYFTHYLPIGTILKLYWPNFENMRQTNESEDSNHRGYMIMS